MKLTINVTQEYIDRADEGSFLNDPICLAVQFHFPGADVQVAGGKIVAWSPNYHWAAPYTQEIGEWIQDFDNHEVVEPFTFEADFEEVKP